MLGFFCCCCFFCYMFHLIKKVNLKDFQTWRGCGFSGELWIHDCQRTKVDWRPSFTTQLIWLNASYFISAMMSNDVCDDVAPWAILITALSQTDFPEKQHKPEEGCWQLCCRASMFWDSSCLDGGFSTICQGDLRRAKQWSPHSHHDTETGPLLAPDHRLFLFSTLSVYSKYKPSSRP